MTTIAESTVEDAALAWLESLGWRIAHGPDIAPDTPGAERSDYGAVVLERRLRDALVRLNPNLPTEALAVPHAAALRIRGEVAFFQAVRAVLAKRASGDTRPQEELDHAVRQIVSRAVASEGVLDIFSAAGLEKPDISVLSDEFLAEVRDNVTIDWTLRENVRANLRRLVKRILRKHGYPPDKQERATRTVLEQAEVLSAGWAA